MGFMLMKQDTLGRKVFEDLNRNRELLQICFVVISVVHLWLDICHSSSIITNM